MCENLTKTICPDVQELMLNALPNDGQIALKLLAQFTANAIISVKSVSADDYIKDIKAYLDAYKGT